MKTILKTIFVVLCIIFLKLMLTFSLNEIIINNYNNGKYNTYLSLLLNFLNFSESYIAPYNTGNICYKLEDYEYALSFYHKALDKDPPERRICDVRVNYSLALIKNIDLSDTSTIYDQLEYAKQNLYLDNCASPTDDSGKSKYAEQLEEEIKKLQEQYQSSSNSSSEDCDNESNTSEEQEDYSDIEEQLKEDQKEAGQARQEDLNDNDKSNRGYSTYDGKRW